MSNVILRQILRYAVPAYMLLLLGVYWKQHKFLVDRWRMQFESASARPESGIHFARELQSFAEKLDCREKVGFFYKTPDDYQDFHVPMMVHFALAPCCVVFYKEEADLELRQKIFHRSFFDKPDSLHYFNRSMFTLRLTKE